MPKAMRMMEAMIPPYFMKGLMVSSLGFVGGSERNLLAVSGIHSSRAGGSWNPREPPDPVRVDAVRVRETRSRQSTVRGSFPPARSITFMQRWPGSAVAPNMHGQPPGMMRTPCSRHAATAVSELLPGPMPRCSHTRGTPASTASATTASVAACGVTTTTPSTPPGIEETDP